MRTPAESGRATAALLPRARVVEVRGNGHDQVDTDATGCVARALKRWIDRKAVGDPCRGRSNQVDVMPQPPRSVTEFKASRQVPGARGRTLLAVIDTAGEVRFSALEAAFGGLDPRGGGLRGGSYEASDAFEGTVRLRHYEYVPGVRVSGTLRLGFNSVTGSVRVAGAVSGRLRVNTSGGASGVLNGRTVRFRRSPATASAWQGGALRVPGAPRSRAAAERRLSRLGLR